MSVMRTALVTGAGRGIGRACALALAETGVAVLVTDLDGDAADAVRAEIADRGGVALAQALDTTSSEEHARAIDLVSAHWGGLDVAVNNAGITQPATDTADISPAQWRRVLDVNLDGVFYGVRLQLPALLERGGGVIVTISSLGGVRGLVGMSPYAAAKHAINGLMKTVALEYGSRGVRALAVGPAYVATGLERNLPADVQASLPGLHALNRIGQPEEIGAAVAWLASPAASLITGSYIPVDGGYLAR
ncbi:MAG: short-chain dehydrogenase [Microbacterium sp.]|uniref:Short-chain dehydrogenase n=2 Tax=Microbacterium TaxID=33882 RepID=A0A3C1KAQ0_9MICO|nr:short-chain dehydrogenase [Microbacterium sp.]HAN23735.1 short-chain dehydrogenase [Microbacterium ginsengisoli]